ncbi:DUF6634 family protein [Lichenifustis flavocetrariae]|uniref:Uncharacterized protein n=1 Tax=Lichenifustis flavocetrariae TaxID=2949735 RepID=A0AA41Z0T9_9HYPH|nr:DUF6634 family protein [Lichenifustis flavocetrariae]MCW6512119.1 hypothetical protein [Lichenifustis flavocetrariae]
MTDCPYTDEQLAQREAALHADLARYAESGSPTADELRRAPMLDDYRITSVDGVDLAHGWCVGHPRLRPGRITTAKIAAAGDGWLRTVGRLYRLGDRLDPEPEFVPSPDDAEDHLNNCGR